jgi:hypothetical protein
VNHALRHRLHVSRSGRFIAIANDYGQFGSIVDSSDGREIATLDGGSYHSSTVPFSVAFSTIDGREVVIHRTESTLRRQPSGSRARTRGVRLAAARWTRAGLAPQPVRPRTSGAVRTSRLRDDGGPLSYAITRAHIAAGASRMVRSGTSGLPLIRRSGTLRQFGYEVRRLSPRAVLG